MASFAYSSAWLDICNRALALVGRATLTSLDDETGDAELVAAFLPQAVAECASVHDWSFLRRSMMLPLATSEADAFGRYRYQLPSDMDALMEVRTERENGFRVEGDLLLTDSSWADVTIRVLPTVPSLLPQQFQAAVAYNLASLLSVPLTGDQAAMQMMSSLATNCLTQLKSADTKAQYTGGTEYWSAQIERVR